MSMAYTTRADDPANVELRAATGFAIGDRVIIRGGFENGITGTIVANEPMTREEHARALEHIGATRAVMPMAKPYRFRVRFERCPYHGNDACAGSPRTANGSDIDAFYRAHPDATRNNRGTIGGIAPIHLERGLNMDPDATLAIVRDDDADLRDRIAAALELSLWIFHGGYLPAGLDTDQAHRLSVMNQSALALLEGL